MLWSFLFSCRASRHRNSDSRAGRAPVELLLPVERGSPSLAQTALSTSHRPPVALIGARRLQRSRAHSRSFDQRGSLARTALGDLHRHLRGGKHRLFPASSASAIARRAADRRRLHCIVSAAAAWPAPRRPECARATRRLSLHARTVHEPAACSARPMARRERTRRSRAQVRAQPGATVRPIGAIAMMSGIASPCTRGERNTNPAAPSVCLCGCGLLPF